MFVPPHPPISPNPSHRKKWIFFVIMLFFLGLEIRSFDLRSLALFYLLKRSIVSESLSKNEWLAQKNVFFIWILQFPLLFMPKERIALIDLRSSILKQDRRDRFDLFTIESICQSQKNDQFNPKTDDQIPNPDFLFLLFYRILVRRRWAYPLNSRVGRFCTFSSCTCMVVCGSPCLVKYKNVFDFGPKC